MDAYFLPAQICKTLLLNRVTVVHIKWKMFLANNWLKREKKEERKYPNEDLFLKVSSD